MLQAISVWVKVMMIILKKSAAHLLEAACIFE